jgi:hypothetical protein
MPLAGHAMPLNRSNCIPALIEAFQSNAMVKALVVLPGVTDDFYLVRRDGPPLNLRPRHLLEAINRLTNGTDLRVTFRQPFLLLHLDRDSLEPAVSIRNPATVARLTGRSSFERVLFSDRPWDTLQPVLARGLSLTVQPKAKSQDAVHLTRVNLAGWHLTDWELLEALSLAGRTRFTVFRSRVSFEPNPRRVRPF